MGTSAKQSEQTEYWSNRILKKTVRFAWTAFKYRQRILKNARFEALLITDTAFWIQGQQFKYLQSASLIARVTKHFFIIYNGTNRQMMTLKLLMD